MSYDSPALAQRKINRLDERIADLHAKRIEAVRERGAELGFSPMFRLHGWFCTMNCSTAPGVMKVSYL